MFLLSAGERLRRVFLTALLLAVLCFLALAPPASIEWWAGRLIAPLAELLAPIAGTAADALLPEGRIPEAPPQGTSLIELERSLGRPGAVAGVAWLEVPVYEHLPGSGLLRLAAGREHGIAVGHPVVFGRQWLGRIEQLGAGWAEVQLWSGANARTGVSLGEETIVRAVCIGRSEGLPPVVRFPEVGDPLEAGMTVLWRRRADDLPALEALPLKLGLLELEGDPVRGDSAWVVPFELPPGAEGRVYIAAGAVAGTLVAEPPILDADAHWVLRTDGVFGRRLSAAETALRRSTVFLQGGRVFGRVVASRGGLVWVRRRAPSSWSPHALSIAPDRLSFAEAPGPEEALFTRGGHGVPRGLWLGRGKDRAPSPNGRLSLRALAREAWQPMEES